jgi:hypothetical protein
MGFKRKKLFDMLMQILFYIGSLRYRKPNEIRNVNRSDIKICPKWFRGASTTI